MSRDDLETCGHCGAPMAATSGLPSPPGDPGDALGGEFPETLRQLWLDPDAAEPAADAGDEGRRAGAGPPARRHRRPAVGETAPGVQLAFGEQGPAAPPDGADPGFRIGEDLFGPASPAAHPGTRTAPFSFAGVDDGGAHPLAADTDWQAGLRLDAEPALSDPGGGPVIDRDEEVPDRFWVPEVAGLGRRAAALLVDQALLALLLGLFVLGASLALRLSGLAAGVLFTGPGFLAALPPFALLALLQSVVYHTYFHGQAGCTPGKALAGVAVRTGDGAVPSRGRAALRWLGALLGLGCAGVGFAWALFEPRRRGWADLLSATVVAESGALRRPPPRR